MDDYSAECDEFIGPSHFAYATSTKIERAGSYMVKLGNFRPRVNSDIHLQTVEIQMRRLLMPSHHDFHCLLTLFISFIPKTRI